MGHDSQINSVEFSHKNQLIISSSEDGTARIWKPGKVDAAAVMFVSRYIYLFNLMNNIMLFVVASAVCEGGLLSQAAPCACRRTIADEEWGTRCV